MKTRTHYRFNQRLVNVTQETPVNRTYGSINKAKKASLKIQMSADGALGRGTVGIS